MDETVAAEIEEIRTRLGEINDERMQLPAEDARREDLVDEEHKLQNQLAELEDRVAEEDAGEAEKEAAAQTDLTRSPELPDSKDES